MVDVSITPGPTEETPNLAVKLMIDCATGCLRREQGGTRGLGVKAEPLGRFAEVAKDSDSGARFPRDLLVQPRLLMAGIASVSSDRTSCHTRNS